MRSESKRQIELPTESVPRAVASVPQIAHLRVARCAKPDFGKLRVRCAQFRNLLPDLFQIRLPGKALLISCQFLSGRFIALPPDKLQAQPTLLRQQTCP